MGAETWGPPAASTDDLQYHQSIYWRTLSAVEYDESDTPP